MMTEAGCSKTSTLVMVAMMSMLLEADVPVRPEVLDAEQAQFDVMAAPGAVLSGSERVGLVEAARSGQTTNPLQRFAHHLYADPGTIHAEDVFAAVDATSDPAVVETIGVVARLSSVDRTHLVLNVALQPLPTPSKRSPTARVAKGLKHRRGHIPMPPGAIPTTLDLVPSEGAALRNMLGPMYMTENEMSDPLFARNPGLNTPQLETVAARISLINKCFY